MLVLEERWKDSAQAQVLSNKALEEGKIAAWCMGSGQLLERHSLQNSNHHSGGGGNEQTFSTADSCKRMQHRDLQAVNSLFVCMLNAYCH